MQRSPSCQLPSNILAMKSFHSLIFSLLLSVLLLSGCETLEPSRTPGDFVRSINFSPLDTFRYDQTIVSGMPYRDTEDAAIKALSNQVLTEELVARGFEAVESDSDFYIVAKWHKELSAYAGIFDSVDGPTAAMNRRNYGSSSSAVRFTLTVEIYDSTTKEMFWRAELPNIFDAIQYSEKRVALSLSRAIQRFPERVEKDPNLPNIE